MLVKKAGGVGVAIGAAIMLAPALAVCGPASSSALTSTSTVPGTPTSPATFPTQAASPTPAASPIPSTSPAPQLSTGGQWLVNGATVKAVGALATEIDAGGNAFTGSAKATKGSWVTQFGVNGQGPVTLSATVTGPGPVIDASGRVFQLPITIKGTPGKDLSISVATPRGAAAVLGDAVPAAAVKAPVLRAESPEQAAGRIGGDWLSGAIAFTIIGWLLLLIAPGLRGRGRNATRSLPFSRLGIGAILVLDIPLAALLVLVIGVPLGLWWIGLIALAMFLALVIAGYAFCGYQLGVLLLDRLGYERLSWLLAVPAGVILLTLLSVMPYVGALVSLLAVCYGIGSMLYAPAVPSPAVAAEELAQQRAAEAPVRAGKPLVE
jgi:hypothetical protein